MKETSGCPFMSLNICLRCDSHTIQLAACASVCTSLCICVPYITIRYAKSYKCMPQQNAMTLFTELSQYKCHKGIMMLDFYSFCKRVYFPKTDTAILLVPHVLLETFSSPFKQPSLCYLLLKLGRPYPASIGRIWWQ